MKYLAFILSLAFAAPVGAQTLLGDAFGLYPAGSDPLRAQWAGVAMPVPPSPGALEAAGVGTGVSAQRVTGGAPDTVLIFFGQKSIAVRTGWGQIAAILFDSHGNLAADGTVAILYAGDGAHMVPSRLGIASRKVFAGARIGLFHAWAETVVNGDRHQTARVTYRVVPALRNLASDLVSPKEPLLAEEMVRLKSRPPLDGSAQELPEDGVASQVLLTHEDGSHSLVPAIWVEGKLQARLLTRDIAGSAVARLQLPYRSSAAVPLVIKRLQPGGPLGARLSMIPDLDATRIVLGPFTTRAGHYLIDGSLVTVRIVDATGRHLSWKGWLLDGMAKLMVPSAALPFTLRVSSPTGVTDLVLRREQTP